MNLYPRFSTLGIRVAVDAVIPHGADRHGRQYCRGSFGYTAHGLHSSSFFCYPSPLFIGSYPIHAEAPNRRKILITHLCYIQRRGSQSRKSHKAQLRQRPVLASREARDSGALGFQGLGDFVRFREFNAGGVCCLGSSGSVVSKNERGEVLASLGFNGTHGSRRGWKTQNLMCFGLKEPQLLAPSVFCTFGVWALGSEYTGIYHTLMDSILWPGGMTKPYEITFESGQLTVGTLPHPQT